jgi:hypothetical protein
MTYTNIFEKRNNQYKKEKETEGKVHKIGKRIGKPRCQT